MKEKVLIVIDMQNDFITGSLGSPDAEAIVPCVRAKVKEYVNNKDLVMFTKDSHFENYFDTLEGKMLPVKHCILGTEGWEICDELQAFVKCVFHKCTFGYLEWEDVMIYPQTAEKMDLIIEICGLCTDICVVSNALILRAMYPDARIIVDAKCCAGTTPEKHKAALEVMKSCQIEVYNE